MLTGETFPVEKTPGTAPPDAPLAQRHNMVFMGTSVRSGTARALIAERRGALFGDLTPVRALEAFWLAGESWSAGPDADGDPDAVQPMTPSTSRLASVMTPSRPAEGISCRARETTHRSKAASGKGAAAASANRKSRSGRLRRA